MFIWNLPTGVCVRDSVKGARDELIKSLYNYNAINSTQTTSAADTFMKKIYIWILELHRALHNA